MDPELEQITEAYQLKCDELIHVIKQLRKSILENFSYTQIIKVFDEMDDVSKESLWSLIKQGKI